MKRIVCIVVLAALTLSAGRSAAQDADAGKVVFKKCTACHAADTSTNKIGPHLGDVVGRTAGTVTGYNYSQAMHEAGVRGLVWDEANFAEFITAPKKKVPGTKMAFAGLKNPDEIRNLFAYLQGLEK